MVRTGFENAKRSSVTVSFGDDTVPNGAVASPRRESSKKREGDSVQQRKHVCP